VAEKDLAEKLARLRPLGQRLVQALLREEALLEDEEEEEEGAELRPEPAVEGVWSTRSI
jgi:hypothetical protein